MSILEWIRERLAKKQNWTMGAIAQELHVDPNDWLLLHMYQENEADMIHPDDLDTFYACREITAMFYVVGMENEYIRVQHGEMSFRILSGFIAMKLNTKARCVGETVKLKDERICTIRRVIWHHKRTAPFYELTVEGKKKSKRYWEEDFISE